MKKLVSTLFCIVFIFAISGTTKAAKIQRANEVIVTATKTPTALREIASSLTLITQADIKESKPQTVSELLKTVTSLDMVESGGLGKTGSAFIRGANSEHTLVLINGITLNNPIAAGRHFDFANLTIDGIERIEIIRGPQSTLYGSDALGGVINIITKKGIEGFQALGSIEISSYHTFKENLSLSGGREKGNYFFTLSRIDSDGFSSASESLGNSESDSYHNSTFIGNINSSLSKNLKLKLFLRFVDFESDIDNGGGAGQDDPNHILDGTSYQIKSAVDVSILDNRWQQNFSVSYAKNNRNDNNPTDDDHPLDLARSSFEGKSLQFDWQHTVTPNQYNIISGGLNYEEERGSSSYYSESIWGPFSSDFDEKKGETTGIYLQDQIKIANSFYPTIGIRYDQHNKFGNKTTYKIAPAYILEKTNTKFKGSYGTGFKSPSLFQLYSSYGDENLDPEKSKGYDIGIEQLLFEEKLSLELVYFYNDFDDLIDYDFAASKYLNVKQAETKGIEFNLNLALLKNLNLKANYTYLKSKDKDNNHELIRRAKHKGNMALFFACSEKLNLNFYIKYVGTRKDKDFSTFPVMIVSRDSYTLVDVIASYQLNDHFQIFGKVTNLSDKNYEQVLGFETAGRAFYFGIKAEA
ncbi:TonB-dependent receptor plug domain-containing protein [Candidatus Auribacterota bacterium]